MTDSTNEPIPIAAPPAAAPIAAPAAPIEVKVFDEQYVKSLRDESASYRVKAKELETKNAEFTAQIEKMSAQTRSASLKAAVAASVHRVQNVDDAIALMDKSLIKFNDETGEPEGIDELLKTLLEAKPYLAGKTVTPTNPTNPPRSPSASSAEPLPGYDRLRAAYSK